MRQIARHGQEKRYHHIRVGVNSRLDTLQAAILLPKLRILDSEIAARQQIAEMYTVELRAAGIAGPSLAQNNSSAWAQYTIRVQNRSEVQNKLYDLGVPTTVHYPMPLNQQPAVADPLAILPHGDRAAKEVLSLPMHPYLKLQTIREVVAALSHALSV
jgi:UDP-2-acetamido-2-deoxy-ribo-hexuluronate aminotransferase